MTPILSGVSFLSLLVNAYGTGYYTSTVYYGVTCGNTDGHSDFAVSQTGYSFGDCIVGNDANGIPVSSAIYSSNCVIANGEYQATYTLYSDLNCQSQPVEVSSYNQDAVCFENGDYTTTFTCSTEESKPPYNSLSGGYVNG
jgi:hypothetical protein